MSNLRTKQENRYFSVVARDTKSRARTGVLRTPHGTIHTPSYVMVATHGQIKALKPSDIKKTGTQVVIANTFHLWNAIKSEKLKVKSKKSFLVKKLGVSMPTMTDSGGFQLFSFGAAREHSVGKVLQRKRRESRERSAVKITERGVAFLDNGRWKLLTPELSIAIQEKIGADIMFVLDECTSPLHSSVHNTRALERTNRWALRSLKAKSEKRKNQLLFGIVQGGRFSRLRTASARAIGAMDFDGFGIGGSFGENTMARSLRAVIPHLPDGKPRHLLGIGTIRDIFTAVEHGVDLFDCVIPTREARHGRIWTATGYYDIRKSKYAESRSRLEPRCACSTCRTRTRQDVYRLFKAKNPEAGRLATIHNIFFFNSLVAKMRGAITNGTFSTFKRTYLRRF